MSSRNSNRIPIGERVLFFLFLLKIIFKNKCSYFIDPTYKMDVETRHYSVYNFKKL